MSGTLIAHVDSGKVPYERLGEYPVPEATGRWKPIAHLELVDKSDGFFVAMKTGNRRLKGRPENNCLYLSIKKCELRPLTTFRRLATYKKLSPHTFNS